MTLTILLIPLIVFIFLVLPKEPLIYSSLKPRILPHGKILSN